MTEEIKHAAALKVYETLCSALEAREWHFDRHDDDLVVSFSVRGEDIPMSFIVMVDEDRQLVRVSSPLPFRFDEEKRMEGAIVSCVASYGLVDGSFDYDIMDGSVSFRMTASFRGSNIADGLLQYMISCACSVVDRYNDKLLAVNKGHMSVSEFIAEEG